MTGTEVSGDAFTPAVVARLIEAGPSRLTFRHPPARSGVYRVASYVRRQGIRAALTVVLDGQPNRRVWHQAAAASSTPSLPRPSGIPRLVVSRVAGDYAA